MIRVYIALATWLRDRLGDASMAVAVHVDRIARGDRP